MKQKGGEYDVYQMYTQFKNQGLQRNKDKVNFEDDVI